MEENAVPDERRQRLDAVLAQYLQRLDSGELIDREAFIAQHPDLASDIEAFLNDQQAMADFVHPVETVDFAGSRTGSRSRGLHIRCPHCTNPVELLVDTPYEEITCRSCGSNFSLVEREEATRQAKSLKSIGRFELISRLGVGGFGTVWKARDTDLDRVVAVKIPRKGQLSIEETEQFFREARSAAQLRHPNIVPVHEVGRAEETIFIVCELVRGVELSDWLTAGQRTFREISAICRKIAGALHHAHQQGVIHRDLKPSNVMMDVDGEPQLMDFGLAKREIGEVTMTVDGQVLGTPAYMSPEQAGGLSHWTDRRTDIYSLGVVIFRLLTGELPYRGNAQMQVHQRLTEDAPDPRKLNRHIPKDLSTICLKCLERDPNRRYATAEALAAELDRFEQGIPIQARPISRAARAARWVKRKPALATAVAMIGFLSIAGPITAVKFNNDRQALAARAAENDNLIRRYREDVKRNEAENSQLRNDLDVWEGQANPWTLWPPRTDHPPRRLVLEDLAQRFDELEQQFRRRDATPWEAACGHLALASLAAEFGRSKDASDHLIAAEKPLRRLVADHPQEAAYRVALAANCEELARQLHDAEPERAGRLLRDASQQYAQLIANGHDPNRFRVARLEVELQQAVEAGGAGNAPYLEAATKLDAEIEDGVPSDPIAFYDFIRQLTGEGPLQPLGPPAAGK